MSLRIAATPLRAPRCRGRRGPYSPQGSAAFRHAPCLRQRAVPLATDVPSAFGGPCDSTPEPKFRVQRRRTATGNNDSPIPAAILKARRRRVVPEQDRDRWRFASDGPYAADCSSQLERGAALLKISSRAYREY